MDIISEKKEIAEKAQNSATEKKKKLDIETIQINESKEKADKILQEAIPILEEAQASLNKIKKEELVNMKALANPPLPVKAVA